MNSDQTTETPPPAPDYSSDGVDLTLIRWMLSLTPRERLEVLQASAGSLERLRQVARLHTSQLVAQIFPNGRPPRNSASICTGPARLRSASTGA